MPKITYQGVRAHVSGSYRVESLHGKEYIVVPVVALVEGVLQGMSSSGPELALAEEFGKFPDSWNGRPVVMSHPVNEDGTPISANSPPVLEKYQIGFLFNSSIDSNKLVQEAWVDKSLISNLGGDATQVMEALEKGEMIEVSTGYFAMIEPTSGMFANKKYDAIQREIVPDHLAFLPIGTFGACSNADGCGAQLAANASPNMKFTPFKDFRVDDTGACCSKCAQSGGSCQHDHSHEDPPMPSTNASMDSKDSNKKGKKKGDPKAYEATTIANTIADSVTLNDARSLVSCALKDAGYGTYCYVIAMTTSVVVFEMYDMFSGEYRMYQLPYSVAADGAVTFDGQPSEVALMTQIVPVNNADGNNATGEGEADMPNDTQTSGSPAPAPQANSTKEPRVEKVTNEQGTLEINYDAEGKVTGYKLTPNASQQPKKPQTVEEFIAQAPSEMQEVMRSSLKLHADQKAITIKALKDSGRCKFSDDKLNAMSLQDLQDLADLANVPTYEGRALPIAQASHEEENFTAAPLVFEAPSSKAAA